MATEVVMPRLSDTMDSGTVGKWLKKEGDQVTKGETIAEIETDKANMEMESYANGILARIMVKEGESAALGAPIAVIAADEAEAKKLAENTTPSPNGKQSEQLPETGEPVEPAGQLDQVPPEQAGPPAKPQIGLTTPNERLKASPLARRLAQERDINLEDVAGTGPNGRITKEDVESFLKQAAPIGQISPPAGIGHEASGMRDEARTQTSNLSQAEAPASEGRASQPVEMSRMQQTIARRMTEAKFSAPEFYLTSEIDMTEARAFLKTVATIEPASRIQAGAPKVGPNDLLIKAAALALRRHPEVNSGWERDGIVRFNRVNVGNAVALPGGLVVPVIQDADKKSLGEIAREAKDLIEKARTGKLAPREYEFGTFTISNLGMFGIEQFTAVLNPPEACILAVGAIEAKPVVAGQPGSGLAGEITVRSRMHVTMTCDHRVVNGALGAEFLRTLRGLLEHPMLILL